MDVPVRDVVRAKEPLYAELKLAEASDDDTVLDSDGACTIRSCSTGLLW